MGALGNKEYKPKEENIKKIKLFLKKIKNGKETNSFGQLSNNN